MKINLQVLEQRDVPASTMGYPVNTSFVPLQDLYAYAANPGGGPRIQVQLHNNVIFDQFVFESSFRGGVDVSLVDLDHDGYMDMIATAGPGGGPRVKVFKNDGHNHFNLIDDKFVGDPSSRSGVYVDSNGFTGTGYVYKYAPSYPQQLLYATRSVDGADVSPINYQLQFVPPNIANYLISKGVQIIVYPGPGITYLPEFAYFRGKQTSDDGDYNRTWDHVPSATVSNRIYITPSSVYGLFHELGHVVEGSLPQADVDRWKEIWSTSSWDSAYTKLNEFEAFAESFRIWLSNLAYTPWQLGKTAVANPRATEYFNNLLGAW